MNTGKRIAEKRKQKGLSREKLANQVGISKGYLIKIERETKRAHIKLIAEIANVLDLDLETLLKND